MVPDKPGKVPLSSVPIEPCILPWQIREAGTGFVVWQCVSILRHRGQLRLLRLIRKREHYNVCTRNNIMNTEGTV